MNPKISVIVPVYNTSLYLDDCLKSATQPGDVEIICVDDASTDDSIDILNKWANKDERIIVLKHDTNKGLSATRNTALEKARGDYILFLDSDDMFKDNIYRVVLMNMRDIDALWFNAASNMNQKWWYVSAIYPPKISGREMFTKSKIDYKFREPTQLWAIRRSFLNDIGLKFHEGIYFEDELFTVSMLMKAKSVSHIKDILYFYRRRPNSITTKKDNAHKKFKSLVTIISEYMDTIYTDEPEPLKRAILMHMSFLLNMMKYHSKKVSRERMTEYEKELLYLADCCPDWMQNNQIERYIHNRLESK